jgi:hypothetical protein
VTISAKPVGVGAAFEPWIARGERSGLLTRIATTESVSLCTRMKRRRDAKPDIGLAQLELGHLAIYFCLHTGKCPLKGCRMVIHVYPAVHLQASRHMSGYQRPSSISMRSKSVSTVPLSGRPCFLIISGINPSVSSSCQPRLLMKLL